MVRLRGPNTVIKSAKLHPAEAEKLKRSGRNAREAIEYHNMVTLTPIGSLEIDIHFLPNVPDNASEQIDNLQKLDGHVSTRTKLSAAPAVVPDPDAEIERMQQEEEARLQIEEERQSQYMGFSQKLQPEELLKQLQSEADSRQVTLQELIGQLEGSRNGEEQS